VPEISLLQPTVMNGVIRTMDAPQELLGLSMLPKEPHPFPTVRYDTLRGSRLLSKPNVPNSEAHIVPKLGVGQLVAGYFYIRDKKVFEPTTLYWIRQPGTLATKYAEAAVLRETQDLSDRVDRFVEFTIWQGMFAGAIHINEPDVKANVDFQIASSHKPTVIEGEEWTTTSEVVGVGTSYTAPAKKHITTWKRLMARDSLVQATDVYLNSLTLEILMRNIDFRGINISDRQRDALLNTGSIPGLWGLDWHEYDLAYDTGSGIVPFIPDGKIVIVGNTGRPFALLEGPSADFDAGADYIGKFTKSWREPDPSAWQTLIEYNFFPALFKPDQVILATVFDADDVV
jgi:hypothetical protein